MQGDEHRIAVDLRQHEMEGDVRFDESLPVADGLAVSGELPLEFIDLRRARLARRMAGERHLEEQTNALKVPLALLGGQELHDGRPHAGNDGVRGRHRHSGARAVRGLDQSCALEGDQSLANGRTPNAKAVLQVALGGQLVARLQPAVRINLSRWAATC